MADSCLIGALLLVFVPSLLFSVNSGADDLIFQDMDSKEHLVHIAMVTSRTLKDDQGFVSPSVGLGTKGEMVGIEDYDPVDPVPSSKTSVKHGPIQHGTPLIPHIPKPLPPNYPPFP